MLWTPFELKPDRQALLELQANAGVAIVDAATIARVLPLASNIDFLIS